MIRQRTGRTGSIPLISIFPFLTLLVLITLQINVAGIVTRRVLAQHAADAAAHAAALEMARAMNAITALQHLIGQLNALGALVMSFGGLELEEGNSFPLNNSSLRRAYADALRYGTTVHPVVGYELLKESKSASGASIGLSRRRLKEVMTWAYRVHAAGGVLATEPVLHKFRGVGVRLVNAAVAIEENVVFEWKVLATMEKLAKHVFLPLKHISNPTIIPYLHDYSIRWAEDAPARAAAAARAVARTNGDIDGTLFPPVDGRPALRLPIEHEPQLDHGSPHLQESQMVRAMTPWVQYYRPPILSFGRQILPLSRFARFYHEQSNGFTLKMAVWQAQDMHLKNVIPGGRPTRLFRLIGTDPGVTDKGREIWNSRAGSARADELFCILGFARHAPVSVMGYPAFPQTQPDGIAGSAQAMIYNANPQKGATRSRWQPVAGWDTLNWENEVPEFRWGKDYGKNENVPQPRVFLNWQVKLVPMTRLKDAAGTQSSQLNRILGRTIADRGIANLH